MTQCLCSRKPLVSPKLTGYCSSPTETQLTLQGTHFPGFSPGARSGCRGQLATPWRRKAATFSWDPKSIPESPMPCGHRSSLSGLLCHLRQVPLPLWISAASAEQGQSEVSPPAQMGGLAESRFAQSSAGPRAGPELYVYVVGMSHTSCPCKQPYLDLRSRGSEDIPDACQACSSSWRTLGRPLAGVPRVPRLLPASHPVSAL